MNKIVEPKDLVAFLSRLFPEFEREWAQREHSNPEAAEPLGYDVDITFHQVFQAFAPRSAALIENSSLKQIREFCDFINESLETPGKLENAISTCLLEHATQIGIRKLINPFLSVAAKKELQ